MVGTSDYTAPRIVSKLQAAGADWTGSITLPRNAASFAVYFFTKTKGDLANGLSGIVITQDGKPARGTFSTALVANYRENLAKELSLYPDDVYAYRSAWQTASSVNHDHYQEDIRSDLGKLVNRPRTADLLGVLVFAYMNLDDETKGRAILKELVAKYPDSPFVTLAFMDYDYVAFAHQIKGDRPKQVAELELEVIKRIPEREDLRQMFRVKASELPFETVKAGCEAWISVPVLVPWLRH
jgi:hypothetical protein